MQDYLVKDWTNVKFGPNRRSQDGQPECKVVCEDDIWKVIDSAKENGSKISIYKVGECVVDWT